MKPDFNKLTLMECVPYAIMSKPALVNTTRERRDPIRDRLFYYKDRIPSQTFTNCHNWLGLLDWFDDWQPTGGAQ